MSRVPDDPAHVPKRKTRQTSLLDIFMSHQEFNKIKMDERARKRAAAEKAAERDEAIAAATAAVQLAPAVPQAPAPGFPQPDTAAPPAGGEVTTGGAAGKAPWTPAEDVALLSLKAQNKTWKEIGQVLEGRGKDELRFRFKDIGPKQATDGPANNAVNEEKGKPTKQKGGGDKKGKGKEPLDFGGEATVSASEPGPAPDSDSEPYDDQPFTDPVYGSTWPDVPIELPFINFSPAIVVNLKDLHIKGILRRGEAAGILTDDLTVPSGATEWNGCPIIYLDENDSLDIHDLSYIYNKKCQMDATYWFALNSHLFNFKGRRVSHELIKAKFQNCGGLRPI
ncbi:MAG: hypothetical protein Q9202_004478 [Teloschistes flavicans]